MAKIKVFFKETKKNQNPTNQRGSGRSRAVSCSMFCLPGGSWLGAVAGSERGAWTWALPIAAAWPLPRPGPARKSRPDYPCFTSREGLFFCDSCRVAGQMGAIQCLPRGSPGPVWFPPTSREACGLEPAAGASLIRAQFLARGRDLPRQPARCSSSVVWRAMGGCRF